MDYYNTLNITKPSSAEEIKKAYKKAAMKNHPDRGGDASKFQQIQEAYDTLSDPQKKQMYDQYGTADPQQMGGNPFGGNPHFNDIFADMFNRGFGQQRRQPQKNRDIQIIRDVDIRDVMTGTTVTISYKLGSGRVETVTADIPAGIQSGQTIRYAGLGDDTHSLRRGDLLIKIRVINNTKWSRSDYDLVQEVKVNVLDLILGTSLEIEMIDGKMLSLKIPAGTRVSAKFNIAEHGMPIKRTGRKGNAYVIIGADVPKVEDEKIIETLKSVRNEIINKS